MRILSACLMPALGTAFAAVFIAGCGPTSGSPQGAPPPNSPPAAPTVSASLPIATSTASAVSAAPATTLSTAPTVAATASGAAGSSTSCTSYAVTHTFAEVIAAKENPDGSLSFTAHPAKVVCGGPDDLHYDVATSTETGTVTPSGTVQMIATTATGPEDRSVPPADFSSSLAADRWGRIFRVTGPLAAVTTLVEMYHP